MPKRPSCDSHFFLYGFQPLMEIEDRLLKEQLVRARVDKILPMVKERLLQLFDHLFERRGSERVTHREERVATDLERVKVEELPDPLTKLEPKELDRRTLLLFDLLAVVRLR